MRVVDRIGYVVSFLGVCAVFAVLGPACVVYVFTVRFLARFVRWWVAGRKQAV